MKKELLILEDNEMMRTFLENYFGRTYKVTALESVSEAWACLDAGNFPDLILADLNMPGTNGLEFLQLVKNSGLFRHIPFIMLSGEGSSKERIRCLENGAVDYVVKPFNPKELELRVRRFITSAPIGMP